MTDLLAPAGCITDDPIDMAAPVNLASMRLADLSFVEALFDALPDVVFFVKDADGRYLVVNHTLVRRSGHQHKRQLIGKNSCDLFPHPMGEAYLAQDRAVIAGGGPIHKHLELHLYATRRAGWCLTHKIALRDEFGRTVGIAGISRDLGVPDEGHPVYQQIAQIAHHIREHHADPLCLGTLAQQVGLSLDRVERLFQRIFHISPRQMLLQARLDAARSLLENRPQMSIVDVALACGYCDHSAFTRQFRATVGMTPTQYRSLARTNGVPAAASAALRA